MSPDDTTPPEMGITQKDTWDVDPGPSSQSPTEPAQPAERCLFIKLPLLAEVSTAHTDDPDQIEGFCALLTIAVQEFLRGYANGRGEELFNAAGVQVAYDDGRADSFCAFPKGVQ